MCHWLRNVTLSSDGTSIQFPSLETLEEFINTKHKETRMHSSRMRTARLCIVPGGGGVVTWSHPGGGGVVTWSHPGGGGEGCCDQVPCPGPGGEGEGGVVTRSHVQVRGGVVTRSHVQVRGGGGVLWPGPMSRSRGEGGVVTWSMVTHLPPPPPELDRQMPVKT